MCADIRSEARLAHRLVRSVGSKGASRSGGQSHTAPRRHGALDRNLFRGRTVHPTRADQCGICETYGCRRGVAVQPENKVMLQSVMSFYVVPERLDVAGRVPRVGTADERQWAADSDHLAAGTEQDFIAWST